MAAKGKQNAGKKTWNADYGDLRFASRRLSSEEAKGFVQWRESGTPDYEDALFKVLLAMYKVALRVDLNTSAYVCAFTQQDDRHPHYNVYLTSRSDDPIEAFFLNCYKIWVIYEDSPITTDDTLNNDWG